MKKTKIIANLGFDKSTLIENSLKFDLTDVVVSENTDSLKYFDEEEVFKIRQYTDHFPIVNRVEQYFRDKPKVGRNETCTCGSDKKYKKCCI